MTKAEYSEIDEAVSGVLPGSRFRADVLNLRGVVMHGYPPGTVHAAPWDETSKTVNPFPVTTLTETKSLAVAAAAELRSFLQTL